MQTKIPRAEYTAVFVKEETHAELRALKAQEGLTFDEMLVKLIHFYQANKEDRGVKIAIAEFCKMNLENPRAPVNIDEVKRRALLEIKNTSKYA